MQHSIGKYREAGSGRLYEVLERTRESTYKSLNEPPRTRYGLKDYITTCGLDVEPMDGALNKFKILQTDKVIERV